MIELDHFEHGSQAWLDARRGIPTGSEFGRIVTPTGKFAAGRDSYIGELLAERILGASVDDFAGSEWMERGRVLEPQAFEYYAFNRDAEPRKTGFLYRDEDRLVGCSPDGMVDPDGVLELKVPMPGKHLVWLARGACPRDYWPQVQGHIWVSGRKWCDFMSYCPGLPPFLVRVEPDEKYQAALDKHIPTFIDELLAGRDRLLEMGCTEAYTEDAA